MQGGAGLDQGMRGYLGLLRRHGGLGVRCQNRLGGCINRGELQELSLCWAGLQGRGGGLDDGGVLSLQKLLLGRGVGVALVVPRGGDAGGRAAIVLVDVFGVAAALVVHATAV